MGRKGPLSLIVKGAAAGIGLVSESVQHKRARSTANKACVLDDRTVAVTSTSVQSDTHSEGNDKPTDLKAFEHGVAEVVSDEKVWELDEAQDEIFSAVPNSEGEEDSSKDFVKVVKQFTDQHPPSPGLEHAELKLPVVLPQRRPKDRTRGFVRAYAPELQNGGIDEAAFLELLEIFNESTLASPWLDAINLASLAFVTLPTAISQAASMAIAIAVDIAKAMQSRHRYNKVLDQLNDDFFRPRGLYALVLTWNPDSNDMKTAFNLNETVSKNLVRPHGIVEKTKYSLRPSMGNTIDVAFSQTAPLVFPVLDSLVNDDTPDGKDFKEKVKNAKGLMAEYFDRRAQAEHIGSNPDSHLAVGPKPVFTSRYSDPNHPSNSGSIVSLVTGGKVNPPRRGYGPIGLVRRAVITVGSGGKSSQGFQFSHPQGQNDMPPPYQENVSYRRNVPSHARQGLISGSVKRVFQSHVLYLSVINMPSDEELATANAMLKTVQK